MAESFSTFLVRFSRGWLATPVFFHSCAELGDRWSSENGVFYKQDGPYNRYKRNYNPYKWPYKWVTGVVSPIRGVTTLLIAGRGPSCMPCFVFYLPTQPNPLYFYIEKTITMFHQEFQVPKMEESWTLCSAILRVGFPLHKPYPYSLYRCFVPPF